LRTRTRTASPSKSGRGGRRGFRRTNRARRPGRAAGKDQSPTKKRPLGRTATASCVRVLADGLGDGGIVAAPTVAPKREVRRAYTSSVQGGTETFWGSSQRRTGNWPRSRCAFRGLESGSRVSGGVLAGKRTWPWSPNEGSSEPSGFEAWTAVGRDQPRRGRGSPKTTQDCRRVEDGGEGRSSQTSYRP